MRTSPGRDLGRTRLHLCTFHCLVGLLLLAMPAASVAQTAGQTSTVSSKRELLADVVAAGALGATVAWTTQVKADACGWCETSGGRDTLNGFDRSLRNGLLIEGGGARTANTVSHVAEVTTWVVPSALLLTSNCCNDSHSRRDAMRALLWAMTVNTTATSALKISVARERPFRHFGNASAHQSEDRFSSFPSGHASSAFALVFAAASECRRSNCDREKAVWLAGLPLASLSAVARLAADQHYATDVLAGAGVGAAIGWFTPRLYDAVAGNRRLAHIRPAVGLGFAGAYASWNW